MKTILLVEDDLAVQETISDYFSMKTSYKVVTAEDGEIAMDQIMNGPPDLILLDVLLPRVNGLAFLQNLRKTEKAKDIPVIFMSGEMIDETDKKLGLELGAVGYFEKPIDFHALLEQVNSILSGK
ncbi:MAG: response regulator [Candidatus Glassbacteria bacterium]|nr:response regulator [Candidatus Glassbacteria bacterium]